jgi:hypothetical protein
MGSISNRPLAQLEAALAKTFDARRVARSTEEIDLPQVEFLESTGSYALVFAMDFISLAMLQEPKTLAEVAGFYGAKAVITASEDHAYWQKVNYKNRVNSDGAGRASGVWIDAAATAAHDAVKVVPDYEARGINATQSVMLSLFVCCIC